MKLQDIKAGMLISGIEPNLDVEIVAINQVGEKNFEVIYKNDDFGVRQQLLHKDIESKLEQTESTIVRAFTADSVEYKLAMEALRIKYAFYFDPMMAMHSSNIDPLPHQISAVYEHMLPKMPLRFVLADDPGAGKTIMTGLLISELIMREDTRRILIVAPGSLVEQWSTELSEKFGLCFEIFNRTAQEESVVNLLADRNHIIARLDQFARDEDIQNDLSQVEWDLVVVDEAHKMSTSQSGTKERKTKRFRLGEQLRDKTRHLLLLTATPHNGIEKDFNNFMSLLDSDRFFPVKRPKTKKSDITDVMRRVVKEELIKFDGKKLFPERISETVRYDLTDEEMSLYQDVTSYVREEMNRADRLIDKSRKGSVGFAMTALQRRLASSPLAIYVSLSRRYNKLKLRVQEIKDGKQDAFVDSTIPAIDFDDDEFLSEEYEEHEQEIVDKVTAAQSLRELEAEIQVLRQLENRAKRLNESRTDRKWQELSKLLLESRMKSENGVQLKLIIFTEYRDTLTYLENRIGDLLGNPEAVLAIHGGLKREKRRENQERFWYDDGVRILLATDAAGEGINLQVANLMVNYDLPWNPNRIEQRFGRIHRIGQINKCFLWNMVARGTREGEVFYRLLDKIEQQKKDLGDRVYDIIGEIFEEEPLHKLLWKAISENVQFEDGEVATIVDSLFDLERLKEIAQRDALCEQSISPEQLIDIRDEMEKAQARKLQPHFIASFFKLAFEKLGGVMHQREKNRWEIRHIPAGIRQYDKANPANDIRYPAPILTKYSRVCFDKQHVRDEINRSAPPAETLHPAHPLMRAVMNLAIENHKTELENGAVLVDDTGENDSARIIFVIEHKIVEVDNNRQISVEFQFVSINSNGEYRQEGWAPYLDYREVETESERMLVEQTLQQEWIVAASKHDIIAYAADKLATPHFKRVKEHRSKILEKERQAVHARLYQAITYQNKKLTEVYAAAAEDPSQKMHVTNHRRQIEDLQQRYNNRMDDFERRENLQSLPPKIISAMLIIPAHDGNEASAADVMTKRQIEKIAMDVVMQHEKAMGHYVTDVSEQNCGWDITALPPAADDGSIAASRHIEVKGRQEGSDIITVTRNEILSALNQGKNYFLAVVLVGGENTKTYYIHRPFTSEPDASASSVNYTISKLIKRSLSPEESRNILN